MDSSVLADRQCLGNNPTRIRGGIPIPRLVVVACRLQDLVAAQLAGAESRSGVQCLADSRPVRSVHLEAIHFLVADKWGMRDALVVQAVAQFLAALGHRRCQGR